MVFVGSFIIIIGSIMIVVIPSGDSYNIANQAAIIMGFAIFISSILEFKNNIKNLIRIDVLMLIALYGLTLLEFLFQQQDFNRHVQADNLNDVMILIAIGFSGIAIGRHVPFHSRSNNEVQYVKLSQKPLMLALILCTFIGYFHMLLAVGFNPIILIEEMLGPRFSQSWSRGRYGGLSDLLNELGLLIYLIPAYLMHYLTIQIWKMQI